MGKKSRHKGVRLQQGAGAEAEVGPRQPCPCGSGRRYKACHGAASGSAPVFVARPFAGFAGECDLIAMRELVPAATAPLTVRPEFNPDGKEVRLCTLLPMAAPALVREDGSVWLGLQVQHNFGDPSRDLAAVLVQALAAGPGGMVGLTAAPGPGPRLQDVVVDEPLRVSVHEGFDFWLTGVDQPDGQAVAALDQANASVQPTARLTQVSSAYWVDSGSKEHLRWVMPQDEDLLLDALSRLHAAGDDELVANSRLVGMFRAHGLLTPVWDLPVGTGAEALEDPAERFAGRLEAALADSSPLTPAERSARSGLANRQVTIR